MTKATCTSNYEEIVEMKNDIKWIKTTIFGVFAAIVLNIIINLLTITR